MSLTILPILLIFGIPAVLAAALIAGAVAVKRRWVKWVLGGLGTLAVAFLVLIVVQGAPYMWASHLEARWTPAKPSTRAEMESYLSLYRAREIQPSASDWGRNHVLREGDKMVQYMILWNAPLEVVYDRDGKLLAFYTSYE